MAFQPLAESDLLKIRAMTVPENYHQVVHGIFDKKLRSFIAIESKQQMLQRCQELLIDKTVQYMNSINYQEKTQLNKLNALNSILMDKQTLIKDIRLHVIKQEIEIKDQKQQISSLTKEVDALKKAASAEKIKMASEINKYIEVIKEQQKTINLMKSEHGAVKSSIEATNKELNYQLGIKTTELKNSIKAHKEEVTILKSQKEKESMEFNRKFREKVAEYESIKEELMKDKKYLQDLIEVKEDEIKEAKKPKVKKYVEEAQFSFCIRMEKEKEKEKQKEKEKEKEKQIRQVKQFKQKQKQKELKPIKQISGLRSRSKTKQMIRQQKQMNFKNLSAAQTQSIILQQHSEVEKAEIGIQCIELKSNESTERKKQTVDMETQTIIQDPSEQRELNQLELKLKYFMEEKYKILFDEKSKEFQLKLKEEYLESMRIAQRLMNSLKETTDERIEFSVEKMREIEEMYEERPSREQDLELIKKLLTDNEALTELCAQAHRKTDSAYIALQEYHSRLESYKNSVPVNISGYIPPKMNSQKTIRDARASFKNFRMNTTSSHNFQKRLRMDDDIHNFTKQVLVTEYDTEVILTPMRKARKSRPETTNRMKRNSLL